MKKCVICNSWHNKETDYCSPKCRTKLYYQKNREKILEKAKKFYSENKELVAERNKKYYEKRLSKDTEKVREDNRIRARKHHEKYKDDEEYKKMKAENTKRYLKNKKQGLVWEVERENGEIERYRLSENIYIERVVDLNSNGNINKVINYLMINGEEHTSTDFGYSLEELKRIGEENYETKD